MFPILPCSSDSLSSSDFDKEIHGSHSGSRSYGINLEKSRIIDPYEELSLLSSVGKEDISLSEYSIYCVSSGVSYNDSRVDISFCKFSLSSKTLELDAVEKSLGYCKS